MMQKLYTHLPLYHYYHDLTLINHLGYQAIIF